MVHVLNGPPKAIFCMVSQPTKPTTITNQNNNLYGDNLKNVSLMCLAARNLQSSYVNSKHKIVSDKIANIYLMSILILLYCSSENEKERLKSKLKILLNTNKIACLVYNVCNYKKLQFTIMLRNK